MRIALPLRSGRNDLGKIHGLERSAADQAAVDIRLRKQLTGVAGVHGAAVQDADPIRNLLAE